MTDQRDVWLVVPMYNETQVVRDVILRARRTFPNVVCVDDGSQDSSAAEAAAAGAVVVRHPINLGQGAALQTGIEYARNRPGARYLVTFDADGQHNADDVSRMIARLRTEPLDVVLGTRFQGNTGHIPLLKRLVLRTVVMMSPRAHRLKLTDSHNGLRAMTVEAARKINLHSNGMAHADEFVDTVDRERMRVTEEPVTINYTDYSMSKGQSLLNGVNILVDSAVRRRS